MVFCILLLVTTPTNSLRCRRSATGAVCVSLVIPSSLAAARGAVSLPGPDRAWPPANGVPLPPGRSSTETAAERPARPVPARGFPTPHRPDHATSHSYEPLQAPRTAYELRENRQLVRSQFHRGFRR